MRIVSGGRKGQLSRVPREGAAMHNELENRGPRSPMVLQMVAAIIFVSVIAIPRAAPAQGLQWMHLLSPGVGWVASSAQVFWTSDNG